MEEEDDFHTSNIAVDLTDRKAVCQTVCGVNENGFPRKFTTLLCVHLDLQKISPKEVLQSTIYFGI